MKAKREKEQNLGRKKREQKFEAAEKGVSSEGRGLHETAQMLRKTHTRHAHAEGRWGMGKEKEGRKRGEGGERWEEGRGEGRGDSWNEEKKQKKTPDFLKTTQCRKKPTGLPVLTSTLSSSWMTCRQVSLVVLCCVEGFIFFIFLWAMG